MGQPSLDKHQLAGLDARERGFSRPVTFTQVGNRYRAILRYETILIKTDPQATQDEALCRLIDTLQADGYRQLRTQVSFRGGIYLGSQELWVEYPDPAIEPEPSGFMTTVLNWFRPRKTNE
ncbi:MAG: hypothetical protein OEV08_05565 [Nitrospira sp.]|nr:hypothetical protein [Nitrospira sp.]